MLLNRERALKYLRAAGLDALIATSPISILYVSDYFCWLDPLLKNYMMRPGAEIDHFISSPRGLGLLDEPDYELAAGDTMFVDFGCVYRHYYSDNGTTFSVGGLSPALQERYFALAEGLAEGVRHLRPGVRASEVHAAMLSSLAESGITRCNAHGHGVGLEVRDYPIIVADTGLRIRDDCVDVPADLPFEPGMVVNLEMPLFLAGVGSLHIEHTFLLGVDGPRRLDAAEVDPGPIVVSEAVLI